MRRHDSSTTCDRTTISQMRWRHYNGCVSQNSCSTSQIAVLTFKFCTTARHDIWHLLSPSLTYLVGELCGQPPGHTAHQTVYCWQPCLSVCCSSSLEQSARGRHLIVITAVFPASTKDILFNFRINIWFSDCLSDIVTVSLVTLLFTYLLTSRQTLVRVMQWHELTV